MKALRPVLPAWGLRTAFFCVGLICGVGMLWIATPGQAQSAMITLNLTPDTNLQAAIDQAQTRQAQGLATELTFAPGIYQQSATLTTLKTQTPGLVILRAAQPGTVIFEGSDIWTDWQTSDIPGHYTHAWPYRWGFSGNPWTEHNIDFPLLMQRGELAWVNDQRLEPVLDPTTLQPGQFAIEEATATIHIALPTPLTPDAAEIKVSIRPFGLTLDQAENVTLQGLRFQHYRGTFTGALNIRNSQQIRVEDCVFQENNWTGLNIDATQFVTVKNVLTVDNGMRGLGGAFIRDLTVENVESRGNNWRGHLAGYYDWDAGEKFFYLRRATFTDYRAINNYSAGLWLDSDYQDIRIEGCQLLGNAVVGLFIEAGPGPILVKNCIISGNYAVAPNYLQTPGLFGWAATDVTLEHNWIGANRGAQIGIRDLTPRDVEIPERQTQVTFVSQNWQMRDNWIIATQASEQLLTTLNGQPFLDTLTSENNHWLSFSDTPFRIQGKSLRFEQWQALTGQDQSSQFTSLAAAD